MPVRDPVMSTIPSGTPKPGTYRPVQIHISGAGATVADDGGWCAVLTSGIHRHAVGGSARMTTVHAMELKAAVEGLAALKRPSTAIVHCYSSYLELAVTSRLPHMKAADWTEFGKPVEDVETWKRLDALCSTHDVVWLWATGPGGDAEGERAVEAAIKRMRGAAADGD
jgi:ribonuclease HI